MKTKRNIFLLLSIIFCSIDSWGQFFTIQNENAKRESHLNKVEKGNGSDNDEECYFLYRDSVNNVKEDNVENIDEFFSTTDGHEIFIEKDIPVFVSMKDSLLFGLIKQRMDVCLPLDFISVNSRYGTRTDPFTKCNKFHDGIDLKANFQRVYSMLPGTVSKVVYSNRGYGNHVVIDHGHIQVLYGHLSIIMVHEGQNVYAGSIVAVSGNSGRSSGAHLHVKISSRGKSLDPTPFIGYLNRYITRLQDRIAYLTVSLNRYHHDAAIGTKLAL